MSKKAKNCHECQHWRSGSFGEPDCAKGHKPRFYLPQTMRDAMTDGFGYKRRCDDFEGAPGALGGDGTAPGSPPD